MMNPRKVYFALLVITIHTPSSCTITTDSTYIQGTCLSKAEKKCFNNNEGANI